MFVQNLIVDAEENLTPPDFLEIVTKITNQVKHFWQILQLYELEFIVYANKDRVA